MIIVAWNIKKKGEKKEVLICFSFWENTEIFLKKENDINLTKKTFLNMKLILELNNNGGLYQMKDIIRKEQHLIVLR